MIAAGAPRRFYKTVDLVERDGRFGIALDGRPLRAPSRQVFATPTRALAALCAGEWDAQDGVLRPETMPLTRLANVAIDHAPRVRGDFVAQISQFAETDLICHRADRPAVLADRQAAAWNPLLDWAGERLGARLTVAAGVIAQVQPRAALDAIAARAVALDDFRLTGLAHAAGLAGSAVIGLALAERRLDGQGAFAAAALDDLYQLETWGEDGEARQRLNNQRLEFAALEQFFAALTGAC
jgi:chaperone required for assembly of F1-ATPase